MNKLIENIDKHESRNNFPFFIFEKRIMK